MTKLSPPAELNLLGRPVSELLPSLIGKATVDSVQADELYE